MRRFRCKNPDKPDCTGEMRVTKTKTLHETVIRIRKCNECGHKIKTREQVYHKDRPKVSFSELQKAALSRKNGG